MKIYIAGPISKGPMDHNLRQAFAAADVVMARGHTPFVPHATWLWQLVSPKSWQDWMRYDKEWLLACEAILRVPGESVGADQEMADAKAAGMLIFESVEAFVAWDDAMDEELVAAFRGEVEHDGKGGVEG